MTDSSKWDGFEQYRDKKRAYFSSANYMSRLVGRIGALSAADREILDAFIGCEAMERILDLCEHAAIWSACTKADAAKTERIAALKAALAALEGSVESVESNDNV